MIKAVVQAIPTYVMSCFKLPDGLCAHMESLISTFWWGSKQGEKKIHWIKWDQLCKGKNQGGMGFRTFKEFNPSMLSKQGWRICHNEDLLLSKCLKGRYFPRGDFLRASIGYNPSYTWRSIIHGRDEVLNCVGFWRVGNGKCIRIWEDNWLPFQHGYKVWSPKPPNIDVKFVSDLINFDIGDWNINLINELFLPFEALQIVQIPLSNTQPDDTFLWGANKQCLFSVKSAYTFLKKKNEAANSYQAQATNVRRVWSKLWNIKTIPRHVHLMWRILHEKLPVKYDLFNKGLNCFPLCTFCDQQNETISHIFKDCDWTKRVWFASHLGINFNNSNFHGCSFNEWVEHIIVNEPEHVIKYVLSICYDIWKVRNKVCFEGLEIPIVATVVHTANNSIISFQNVNALIMQNQIENIPAPIDTVHWSPPPTGWFKLNVDAAGPAEDGNWGMSAVIRDSNGLVAAATCCKKLVLPDSDIAEAITLKLGLEFARDMLFLNIIAESDSLNTITSLRDQ